MAEEAKSLWKDAFGKTSMEEAKSLWKDAIGKAKVDQSMEEAKSLWKDAIGKAKVVPSNEEEAKSLWRDALRKAGVDPSAEEAKTLWKDAMQVITTVKKKSKKSEKSGNILDRVDECIGKTNAALLDISELEMTEIPPETFRLHQVRTLLAFKNPIQGLHNLCYFENLEVLDISRCSLENLDDMGLNTSRFLKKLDISRNNLKSIRVLSSMPFLEEILASRNKLEEIPQELEPLKILKKLDVSYNEIKEPVPESLIVKLKELQDLDLTGNNLDPESMGYKTRQMYEKRLLFSSKSMRRCFVTRALGINKEVIAKEQEVIFRSENQEEG